MDNENLQRWRVGTLIFTSIGWLSIVFSVLIGILAWEDSKLSETMICVAIFSIGTALLLSGGIVEMTRAYIRTKTLLGSFQMNWDEMTSVENAAGSIVFIAPGKQLVMPDPGVWSGKETHQAFALLVEQLEAQKLLPVKKTRRFLPFSRNCKQ